MNMAEAETLLPVWMPHPGGQRFRCRIELTVKGHSWVTLRMTLSEIDLANRTSRLVDSRWFVFATVSIVRRAT